VKEPGLNVLLAGEEAAGLQTLRALARTEHRIAAVLASSADATVGKVARQMGYEIWPADLVKDPGFAARVRDRAIDIILNVHSLHIVHPEVLRAARLGGFNLHPGPLPAYAGLNTISWAIYRGETSYGVTLHEMSPVVDAGRIAYAASFPIGEDDTPMSLMRKCVEEGVPLVMRLLETAARHPDAIPRIEQDLALRRVFGREIPEGGCLDWARPAARIVNFVRACDYHPLPSPWGHPRTRWGDRDIGIARASRTGRRADGPPGKVGEPSGPDIDVACEDEWILVRLLVVDGERRRPAVVLRPGDRLGEVS